METYIRISNRFYYDPSTKSLIDMVTGEIHNEQKDIEGILKILKEDKEFNRDIEKQLRKDFDLPTEIERNQHNWKNDSWFIKIYRTEMREYKKNVKLSPSAALLLFYLQDYIEYKTNRIANKKGKTFTNKDLSQLVDISENPIVGALNELEEKHFIKRVGKRRAREIYFNPYLACAGNEISKDTLDMFNGYVSITLY